MSLPPKDLLVPGPWTVKGNTVLDAHGRTVCVVFARNATAHAYWIAETPKLVAGTDGEIHIESDEIDELRKTVTRLRRELDTAHDEIADGALLLTDHKRDISDLREKLTTLENKAKA
jgi:chromosome segregation ATPase